LRRWAAGVIAASVVSGGVRHARADEAACIAASEVEVGLRKQNKLGEALKQLVICGAPTCPEVIRAECNRRLGGIDAAMPTFVLRATDTTGNDLVAVTIKIDGVVVATSLTGAAMSADPGTHVLRVEAAGKLPVEKTVLLAEAEKGRRLLVEMRDAPGGATSPVVTPVSPSSAPSTTPADEHAASSSEGRRTAGFAVGAIGVATVVVGAIFAGLAVSKWNTAEGECTQTSNPCHAGNMNAQATNDSQTAGSFADVSTGTFIAGTVLLATGVVLVLTSHSKKSASALEWTPTLTGRGGGFSVSW
jgi:hypothetical protein